MHELVPDVPLRHGHAISIDMAYSATLAHERGTVSDSDYKRILDLFATAGLSMDHHQFDEDLLEKATEAILKTRDGKLRAAIPAPLGKCVFLNDVAQEEMVNALRKHKEIMKTYPRNGEGLDAFVDSSDTGYTMNKKPVEKTNGHSKSNGAEVINDDAKQDAEKGYIANELGNGVMQGKKATEAANHASGPEGVDGNQATNGANGGR